MRLRQLPGSCIAIAIAIALPLLPCAQAQFKYPPPLERPLTDYTSGAVASAINVSAGDNMLGGWYTPGKLMSFLIYRCTHIPSSAPIYPSNSSFNSGEGKVAADGTWERMMFYSGFGDMFGNGANPGNNPIAFYDDFFAPNETTGALCWFELYPGTDTVSYENVTDVIGPERIATVDGGGDWYFASVPWVVKPARPNGLTVTWKSDGTERGKPTRNLLGSSVDPSVIAQEFSISTSASSSSSGGSSSDSIKRAPSFYTGCAAVALAAILLHGL